LSIDIEVLARDILQVVFENAEIYSTEEGNDNVLELCSYSAFANAEALTERITNEINETIEGLCDACRNEATSSV
jgi:hypothetical protein